MAITRFEEILSWKKARELTVIIYELTKKEKFSKDYGLKDQIQRASVSIMSNIAEGFDRQTKKEFIQFLYISLGSNSELRTQLYIAIDLKYITEEDFNKSYSLSIEIAKLIFKFIKHLKEQSKP
ncbi:four helix bundle protein [Candidatus Peregrinibacteria bacterium]|jgi:four helix bundle protein|nr:four helix bundle protein [Candidatus Peregrinibacteria bacterium]